MAVEMESNAQSTPTSQSITTRNGVSLAHSNCPRCGGFMVPERYIDLLDDTGQLEFTAERCVQCGEVVDQTILHNRLASQMRMERAPLAKVA